MAMRILKCTINGKPVEVGYDPRESLLDTLRDRLHLTGTKRGCEVGECGACTVLIDGVATDSCLYLTDWAQGKDILTIEGVQKADGSLDPVQQAFIDEFAVQCGFCIPGIIMSAIEMERTGKTYTRDEIRKQLSGHLCRCTGYENIQHVTGTRNECVASSPSRIRPRRATRVWFPGSCVGSPETRFSALCPAHHDGAVVVHALGGQLLPGLHVVAGEAQTAQEGHELGVVLVQEAHLLEGGDERLGPPVDDARDGICH